jgi:hypothetical protein
MPIFQEYIQPSIEFLSLRVDEPVTTLTDLLISAVCLIASYNLKKIESNLKVHKYLKYYFLCMAAGSFLGGLIGHAFVYKFPEQWKLLSWIPSMIAVALVVRAIIEVARPLVKPGFSKLVIRLNLLMLIIASFFSIKFLSFYPVKLLTIIGMIMIAGTLSYFIFRQTGNRGALQFVYGIALASVSAVFFSYEWGIGPWLNHRDISHLILTGSVFIFYKGSMNIRGGSVEQVNGNFQSDDLLI